MRAPAIRAVALAVLTVFALTAPANAAFPGANGKLVFKNFTSPSSSGLYASNPDATGRTLLLADNHYYPQWSPDGQQILFIYCGPGASICKMNADGSGITPLASYGSAATWSPDGTKIAFVSNRDVDPESGQPLDEIYTMNSDGTNQTRLTHFTGPCPYDSDWDSQGPCPFMRDPSWSPDGTKIAYDITHYVFDGDGGYWYPGAAHIEVVNADDGGLLTQFAGERHSPDWSPDGTKIAFYAPSSYSKIYVMNADGTGVKLITNDPNSGDRNPAWSPDGRKLAFDRGTISVPQLLMVMNADGSGVTSLSTGDSYPSWQPLPTASYSHPQSAPQLAVSLVPAFKQCGTGGNPSNAAHSPPLATGSCNPPRPGSVLAAVGIASQSSAQMTVVAGDTDATNGNQADVSIAGSLTDIQSTLGGDYDPNPSGADLTAVTRLRFTDKVNGYGGLAATATEYDFKVPVDCSSTADPSVGSTCSANTTANTLVPGLIQEQRQAVVQTFRVRVDDSGANGIRGDSDDRIFATQGVFVP